LYLIHTRRSRSLLEPPPQRAQLIHCPLREHFHGAVGIVAHPSRDAENVRFTFDEPAKTDALHTPADQETTRLDFGVIGRHGCRAGATERSY